MHYISFLRGINVGGKRKILMSDLRKLFENLHFSDVITYIQSGNILFSSSENQTNSEIEEIIEKAIHETYPFDVSAIVISVKELENAISSNPFYNKNTGEIERLHLTLLKKNPSPERLLSIKNIDHAPDQFVVIDKKIFVYCSGKYSESKLSNIFFENKLRIPATTRKWKTILVLSELVKKR